MSSRLAALLVWALVAAAAVGWALHLGQSGLQRPPGTLVARAAPPVGGDMTRFLGQSSGPAPVAAAPEAAPSDGRFELVGVLASTGKGSGRGVALITTDGQPARAVRVGAEVAPGVKLMAVGRRSADLGGDDRAATTLRLPDPPDAQRGRPGDEAAAAPTLSRPLPRPGNQLAARPATRPAPRPTPLSSAAPRAPSPAGPFSGGLPEPAGQPASQ